ncbi:hypothetical protein CALCODRAFT_432460 [Calocera cornea HHB12733]|uniref:Lytic polysaccharide monooxygenase n=1 Tax=Calocera cornea HHB12733 TaxID=1353952 RepID=A0A165GVC3_9BASI|nr:hypothetical protein CALCODRAFT_432460 [Calocera cornea HHB12733]
MKFSTLLAVVPLLAAQAHAFAIPDVYARAAAKTATKGKTVNAAGKGGNASASSSAPPASSTSTAAASTESTDPGFCGNDPQKSLCLLSSQVMTGLEQDGQAVPEAGQVPSLVSSNNFINFCATLPNLPLTNGQQIKTGSCNAAPMGVIISQDKMPSCKFQNPKNMDVIPANTAFTISLLINNLETGNFVSATSNYYAAPAQINDQGILIGHSHVVIEEIDSLTSTTLTDPTRFAFFKGLNDAAVNGLLSAEVSGGLPPGTYKMSTINSAANHQPALVAVAQHAALDDTVYFTVSDDAAASGAASSGTSDASSDSNTSTDSSTSTTTTEAAATSTAASGGGAKGGKGGNKNNNNTTTSTTTTTSAAETTTAKSGSKSGSKGQVDAGVGGSKNSKTTTTSAAAQTTTAAASGKGGKGQTTVVEPPSCE